MSPRRFVLRACPLTLLMQDLELGVIWREAKEVSNAVLARVAYVLFLFFALPLATGLNGGHRRVLEWGTELRCKSSNVSLELPRDNYARQILEVAFGDLIYYHTYLLFVFCCLKLLSPLKLNRTVLTCKGASLVAGP